MTPFSALHSPAETLHPEAAAETSIERAAAPDLRRYSCDVRMPALPPVDIEPQMRFLLMCSLGETNSALTLPQSQSSSSATSWARPVKLPWPISERAMRITTRSSGWMRIQWVTSAGAAPCARAAPAMENSSASPPPTAALALRNSRRVMAEGVMADPLRFFRVWEVHHRPRRPALAGRPRPGPPPGPAPPRPPPP